MKLWRITLMAVLVVTALVGCGGSEAIPAPADTGGSEVNTSVALDASYENALSVSGQLALGAFQLEETKNAITSEQATALLPLWQAIQGGTLQGEAEMNAVLKQIEAVMTPEQLEAIAAVQLTRDDLQAWAESQGVSLGSSPEEIATRQAEGGQELSPEAQATRQAEGQELSPEAQATRQAMGGKGGGLSEEEREARRATAEASGASFSRGGSGGDAGQSTALAEPLIELLIRRAAE